MDTRHFITRDLIFSPPLYTQIERPMIVFALIREAQIATSTFNPIMCVCLYICAYNTQIYYYSYN